MASQSTNITNLVGNVADPTQTSNADGNTPPIASGRQSEQLACDLHGKYYTAAYRGRSFEVNVATVVIPVTATNLVSVFALLNPPNSGVNAELIDTSITTVGATDVVDQAGWYYSPAVKFFGGTFTTPGTVQNSMVGNPPANKVLYYSAYTHSGAMTLADVIGGWGATTNVSNAIVTKFYDGRLILPPGIAMSIAMATAAGQTTGQNLEARWCEWPV